MDCFQAVATISAFRAALQIAKVSTSLIIFLNADLEIIPIAEGQWRLILTDLKQSLVKSINERFIIATFQSAMDCIILCFSGFDILLIEICYIRFVFAKLNIFVVFASYEVKSIRRNCFDFGAVYLHVLRCLNMFGARKKFGSGELISAFLTVVKKV